MDEAMIVSDFRRADGTLLRITVSSRAALASWLRNWRVVEPETIDGIVLERSGRWEGPAVEASPAIRIRWGWESFDITPETGVAWAKNLESGEAREYDALPPEPGLGA